MNPPTARSFRVAVIATALVFLTVLAGYHMGQQMAQRDNARAADAAGS